MPVSGLLWRSLICFYCGRRAHQPRQDGTVRQWRCTQCEAVNYLDEVSVPLSAAATLLLCLLPLILVLLFPSALSLSLSSPLLSLHYSLNQSDLIDARALNQPKK